MLKPQPDGSYGRSRGELAVEPDPDLTTGQYGNWAHSPWRSLQALTESTLTFGLDVLNLYAGWLGNTSFAPTMEFFNRHAGHKNPATAKVAFLSFRDSLDTADTLRFPVAQFGPVDDPENPTQFANGERMMKIAQTFSDHGASCDLNVLGAGLTVDAGSGTVFDACLANSSSFAPLNGTIMDSSASFDGTFESAEQHFIVSVIDESSNVTASWQVLDDSGTVVLAGGPGVVSTCDNCLLGDGTGNLGDAVRVPRYEISLSNQLGMLCDGRSLKNKIVDPVTGQLTVESDRPVIEMEAAIAFAPRAGGPWLATVEDAGGARVDGTLLRQLLDRLAALHD